MRRRFALLAGLLVAAALATLPAGAVAQPLKVRPRVLTITATPNPNSTGGPVTIFGAFRGKSFANRLVVLYHRFPRQARFTPVSRTRTTSTGFYSFQRAEGVVQFNREWFARVGDVRSRIVHEKVYALVTLDQPAGGPFLTNHRVAFTGKVTPAHGHVGDRVYLQQQTASDGNAWRTVDSGRVRASGAYTIGHRFAHPGSKTVRVLLRRDRFNLRSVSSPVSLDVEQAQNPRFTINASDYSIDEGQSTTISGTLAAPNNAGQTVSLWARYPRGRWSIVASAMTDASGHYAFTTAPVYNAVYRVRTPNGRHTRLLFVSVHDVVTVTPSATSSTVGGTVAFTGSVAPSKVGHIIYLQQKGQDGAFHTVQVRRVGPLSRYTLTHRFSTPGVKTFRVLIPGGPWNARGVSPTVNITVG
jgi:hypothetical protein